MDNNIPPITEDAIKEQFKFLNDLVLGGSLPTWLDNELERLHKDNPILYKFLIDRSQKFAMGVMAIHDPSAIAVSFTLECILIMRLLGTSFGSALGAQKFSDMMTKWFGGGIKGLDDFDTKKK